jgi:hypothetical protein
MKTGNQSESRDESPNMRPEHSTMDAPACWNIGCFEDERFGVFQGWRVNRRGDFAAPDWLMKQ